jgi:PAS domain S-box-containing protein
MLSTWILALGFVLLIAATLLALRLIRVTGRKLAWILIASGLLVLAVAAGLILVGSLSRPVDWEFAVVGTTSAVFFLAGTVLIERVFREIQRTERALAETERSYRNVFENAHVGIYRTTPDGRVLLANPALLRMVGCETIEDVATIDLEKEGFAEGSSRDDFKRLVDRPGGVRGLEMRWRRPDGRVLYVRENAVTVRDDAGRPVCYEGTVEDLTEHRALEEQLLHAQKMEALGRLAGGVAHDFNNLLTAILGYTGLLLDQVPPGAPGRSAVEEIHAAGQRAASLTGQMLVFSRRQVVEARVLDLDEVVAGTGSLLRRMIGEDVSLVTRLNAHGGRVRADPGQLVQVLLNLAVNARDAMPGGGSLTIETCCLDLDDGFAEQHPEVPAGSYALLSVRDTGCGMTPEVRDRIFEPFFTTKEPGRGTGLGLSTVYGVVRQCGGSIQVESEPGAGTTMRVYLPIHKGEVAVAAFPPQAPRPAPGHETVLVVEDDPSVRGLAIAVLERDGYKVIEAAGPREAIAHMDGRGAPIDLLLTDMVMPGMGGSELAAALRTRQPDLHVLLMSGYSDRRPTTRSEDGSPTSFIQKPFSPDRLVHAVRDAIDGA